jgi:hypothetical protein
MNYGLFAVIEFLSESDILLDEDGLLGSDLMIAFLILVMMYLLLLEGCIFFEELLVLEREILDHFQDMLHLGNINSTLFLCILIRSSRRQSTSSF